MLPTVDINAVKEYNRQLKEYKDRSSKLSIEIEYDEKQLKQICEELSKELGRVVTIENISQVYTEQVESMNQTIETGTAVLNKIKQEELSSGQVVTSNEPQGTNPADLLTNGNNGFFSLK